MQQVKRSPALRSMARRVWSRKLEQSCGRDGTATLRRTILADSEYANALQVAEAFGRCGQSVSKTDRHGRIRWRTEMCRNPMCTRCRSIHQAKSKERAVELLCPLPQEDIFALTVNLEAIPFDTSITDTKRIVERYRRKLYNGLKRTFGGADILLLGNFELHPLKSSRCDSDIYPVASDIDCGSDASAFLLHIHAWIYVGEVGKEAILKRLRHMFKSKSQKRVRMEQRFGETYTKRYAGKNVKLTFIKSKADHIKDWSGYSSKMSLKVNGFGDMNAEVEARLVDLMEGCRNRGTQGLMISYGKSRFKKMKELQAGVYADACNVADSDRTLVISVDPDDSCISKVTGGREEPHREADFWRLMSGFRDPRHPEPKKRCPAAQQDEIRPDEPDDWRAIAYELPP